MRSRRLSADSFAIIGLLALIAVAYGDILFFGRGLYLTDLTSYHLPMKSIVRTIVRGGEFPFWNPFFSGGQPLAANPAYEVFYPPQWLLLILPFQFAFQLHILLHIAIAAIATYVLLRDLEVGVPAAVFGSAAFVFGGPYLSLSSKLPLFFSISWMPVVLLFTRRALRNLSVPRGERADRSVSATSAAPSVCGAVFALAMQLLIGEPMMAMQTVALMVGIAVYEILRARGGRRIAARRIVVAVAIIGALAASVAAVQIIPAVDHARDSVRSRPFEFWVVSNWSMPPQRVVEWIMPGVFRHIAGADGGAAIGSLYPLRDDAFLEELYIGIFVVLLAIAGVFARARGAGLALTAVAASVVFAAGDHTPLLRLLYEAHLFREIRYPEKFVLTAAFALAVFAAIVADRLLAGDKRIGRIAVRVAVAWVILAVLAAVAMPDAPALGTRSYFITNAVRAAIAVAVFAVVQRRCEVPLLVAAGVIAVADLIYATSAVVPRMPAQYFAPPPIAQTAARVLPADTRLYHEAGWMWRYGDPISRAFLKEGRGPRFWWLFRNGMFPNVAATYGFPVALEEDIDRTSLVTTDDLREAFRAARLRNDPTAVEPYLRLANIGARLRFPPLSDALSRSLDADPRDTTPVEVVRTAAAPRFWFAQRIERVGDPLEFRARIDRLRSVDRVAYADMQPFQPAAGEVVRSEERANSVRLDVRAAGRALLVLSITGHKYWRATIDGRPTAIVPANVAFQALTVPAGEHRIELRYSNPLIAIGAVVSVIAVAVMIGGALFFQRRSRLFITPAE